MNRKIDHILPSDYEPFDVTDIEGTIPARFARMADAHGNRVAISDSETQMSYAVLDGLSSGLAGEIVERLGTASEPVALLYRSGAPALVAQLATLKSGKFFACLDSQLEPQRLLPLLEDLGVRMMLCSAELEPKALSLAQTLPGCSMINSESAGLSGGETVQPNLSPDSPACVIYTSGSTGPPEGVLISHRSLLHFVLLHTNSTHLRKEDRGLQVCPLSSVASTAEIFPILLNGGTLVPFNLKELGGKLLVELLQKERITVCTFVPVAFRVLLASLPSDTILTDMRLVRLSGDRILRRDCVGFAKHFSADCLLRASYGASESLLCTNYFVHRDHIPDREVVPAGYPLPDTEVLIVDDELNRLGPNETGEIAIKSRYLSSGYWRNDALTAERYLDSGDGDGSAIYLTRDVGYLEPDGCLIHLGRRDARVKIYGKMVTLTDIESAMMSIDGVDEAVVVAIAKADAERFLAAYYVAVGAEAPDPDTIRRELRTRLPPEILPRKIVRLEALPVTDRNKIDRRRLAAEVSDFECRSCPT
ncbi:MAG TPA: AMP-binding protein [Gammaproteobacteria bacterium]|nr:AMP-binding protein [Gammaproteobacteria bacterium]